MFTHKPMILQADVTKFIIRLFITHIHLLTHKMKGLYVPLNSCSQNIKIDHHDQVAGMVLAIVWASLITAWTPNEGTEG